MSSSLLNKINVNIFNRNWCRILSVQQNNKKNNGYFHINSFSYNYKNHACVSTLTKNLSQSYITNTPKSLFLNIQKRNESNFVNLVSDWPTVQLAQKILLHVHEITGLPWWATIFLSAIIARTSITLPFSIIQLRTAAQLQNLKYAMEDRIARLKREAKDAVQYYDFPENLVRSEFKRNVRKEWKALIVKENCHPAKIYVLVFIQVPVWFSFSFAIRNLCYMLPSSEPSAIVTFMEMMVGGFGWVINLVTVDQYMILPISIGLINLLIIEVHRLFRTVPETKWEKWLRYFLQSVALGLIYIATNLPAAINIYWLSSSTFGLLQAFLIQSTSLRRLCRVPITENHLEYPYRYFYSNLKTRLGLSGE